MSSERGDRIFVYNVHAKGLGHPDAPKKWREIEGKWVETRLDSDEVIAKIQQKVIEATGATRLKDVHIGIRSAFYLQSAPKVKSEIYWEKPLPSMRTKVRVTFRVESQEDIDRCIAIEESMFNHFDEAEIGFVDGNDVGGGEFTIYCFGGRKAPLLEAVRDFMQHLDAPKHRIR